MPHETAVDLSDLRVGYLEAGPADGPLAVVLHGFPDSATSWSDVLDHLGERGFHAVAPWLRGYAPTQVPEDGRFQAGAYVRDVWRLHENLSGDHTAVLIGHDIGAAIAYGAAAFEPWRWSSVVTVSVPPMATLAAMMTDYAQLRRSWYTFLFQHPSVETMVAADNYAFLDHLWAEWSPGFVHAKAVEAAKAAVGEPENLRAALGWYRSAMHPECNDPDLAAEQAATATPFPQRWLYIHGSLDQCVGVEAVASAPDGRIIEGAGHFPHLERPVEFLAVLDEFLDCKKQ